MSEDELFLETPGSLSLFKSGPPNYVFMEQSKLIAKIDPEGNVAIDWALVEATEKDSPCWPYARLMLAVRGGTWKPI